MHGPSPTSNFEDRPPVPPRSPPLFTLKVLFSSFKLRDGLSRPTCFRSCRLICSDKEVPKMCTIFHQMLTIASASGAPPVLRRPSCGTCDVPHSLLIALTQSLAMACSFGPFTLAVTPLGYSSRRPSL